MKRFFHRAASSWNHFWFEFDHPWGLALARIQVALVMLYLYVIRQTANLEAFTDQGPVPRKMAIAILPEIYRPPFAWFSLWPDSVVPWVHAFFLLLLVVVLLGAGTRKIGWLAWILHMGFLQRNYSILFGADLMAGLALFFLAFTRCEEHLSVRKWWHDRHSSVFPERRDASVVSSAFARLWQIQWLTIYAYTGMEKLKGSTWWDGTALWTVLGNPQMVAADLGFLRNFHLAIAGLTFATVIFETYFPAAMLMPRLRKVWLGVGVLFHSGIGILMGLWTFSLLMMAPYWLFLTPAEVTRIIVSIRDFRQRIFSPNEPVG